MKRPDAPSATRSITFLALALTLVLGGCDDGFEPLVWGNFPDTVALFSLARPEYVDRPSAYDMAAEVAVVVEQQRANPATFDVAVTEDDEGTFQLLPAGLFADFDIRPGIFHHPSATFESLMRAPREGFEFEQPVRADTTGVYVIRSRQAPNGCFYYGKLEVLELDPAGIMTIRALRNPNCSDRSLVPNAPPVEEDGDGEG